MRLQEPDVPLNGWAEPRYNRPKGIFFNIKELFTKTLVITELEVVIFLGAACFCTFSLIIGCLVKSRERFTGIGQLITMPLFFASNAIYPISLMPSWLKVISHLNPLTYEVDALRGAMLANGSSIYGFGLDCTILLLTLIGLTYICGRLYPQVAM